MRALLPAAYFLVVALYNVFPLPRRSGFRRSFEFAGEAIDRGLSILVFPEGMRTPDGQIHPFMAGAGVLANGLDAPVVPVRISGLYELKGKRRFFAPPGAVTVDFGEPLRLKGDEEPDAVARELRRRVAEL